MPTYADDYDALRALHARLVTVFADLEDSNYTGEGHDYGGVDVVFARDEDTEAERVGKPYLLVDLQDSGKSEWSAGSSRFRKITALVAACANDFNGAIQSDESNPVTAHERMSQDLVSEVESQYEQYRDLGLMEIEIRTDKAIRIEGDEESPGTTVIPHRIPFHYRVS